jgi:drug/metabolite transporter (DMT)-like permease
VAHPRKLETAALTLLALTSFAFNSILTRMGLGRHLIDAGGFAAVRLLSGAMVLALLVRASSGSWRALRWTGGAGPLALLAYALPFSFAYVRIGASAGALVLFGSVQLSMIGWAVTHGERPSLRAWLGLALAGAAMAFLTLPTATRPDPLGTVLMIVAGMAWAWYSLQGKGKPDPLGANARAFLYSAPLALGLAAVTSHAAAVDGRGVVLAAISGGLTSGLGYAIWYRALRGLSASEAAILQLSVPVIAAIAATALLSEHPSSHLVASTVGVLGGVALATTRRR